MRPASAFFLALARRVGARTYLLGLFSLLSIACPHTTLADIYQWEYINPANPSQGKQQSTTLAPDGAGLVPAPEMHAAFKDLTQAYLTGFNLTAAQFSSATLTDADFTDAVIQRAHFVGPTGFTSAQLYSTASYQAGDLSGVVLGSNDLTGWNFAGQNLADATFGFATLTNADLSGAEVGGVSFHSSTDYGFAAAQLYSTASYQTGNLVGIDLSHNDPNSWNLAGQNLSGSDFKHSTLTGVDFTGANVRSASFRSTAGFTSAQLYSTSSYQTGDLTGIDLSWRSLAGWNFTGQNINHASFSLTTRHDGFTAAQLYSTASYQAGDLTGVSLSSNDLTGWDFSGQNLTDSNFQHATLTNVDFSGADVQGAHFGGAIDFSPTQLYSTASYQTGDLSGISFTDGMYFGNSRNNLTNWNFYGQNLTDAYFRDTILTDANFADADIRRANFASTTGSGFTSAQLYSTASYQVGDLSGIYLGGNDLTGWNFSGQNLAGSNFYGALSHTTLTNANLSGANLTDAFFVNHGTTFTNVDFSRADSRGATEINFWSGTTHNLIYPDGHVEGLDLTSGEVMRFWDYNSATPIPIHVIDAMSIDPTGTLRVVLEDIDWGSTISFDPGIPVSLDGTLELLIDPSEATNITSLIGTTFDLFDWTGVVPSGTFDQITTLDGLVWDTTNLYTTGDVTLLEVPGYLFGDFDEDGDADGADFLIWQRNFGTTSGATTGDADGDGDVDRADLAIWESRSGTTIVAALGDLDGDGDFDANDFLKWQRGFGSVYDSADLAAWQAAFANDAAAAAATVPEPTTASLLLVAIACACFRSKQNFN